MPGSREWLYRRLEQWLDAVAPLQPGAGAGEAQQQALDRKARIFMLLAGPGMGKSGELGAGKGKRGACLVQS